MRGQSGLRQRSPGKRAKSLSFEWTSAWCSTPSAAMWASVTRFPPTPAAASILRKIAMCWVPGFNGVTLGERNHLATRGRYHCGLARLPTDTLGGMAEGDRDVGEGDAPAGRVTGLARVGDAVRRPASASSESMRRLLLHLERCGFGGAPRVVSSEPGGDVLLTWVDGWVPARSDEWRLDQGALESVGQLLRAYHDCARGFTPDTGFEEGPQAVTGSQIVCHGDIAPRNTVFRDGRAVAFIDWDGIFVSRPVWDLGHAVWQFAPICRDDDPWLRDWPEPPDRSARIAALCRGYRLDAPEARCLGDVVVEVIAGCRRSVVRKAAAGIPAFVALRDEGVLDELDDQRRAAERYVSIISDAALTATS